MKSQEAYEAIRAIIIRIDPNEGVSLSENYFAETLGMSRTPIRAALQQLQFEGLINIVPHQGIFIREIGYEEAWQLFDFRGLVERYLYERTVPLVTAEDVEVLAGMLGVQAEALEKKDFDAFLLSDNGFHMYIYRHYDNPGMKNVVRNYKDRLYRSRLRAISQPGRAETSLEDHRRIVAYLREGQTQKAVEALGSHLFQLENSFKNGKF